MKESTNPHLKVQELCDCFAETDPLKEMSTLIREPATDEAALKWIALAVLHGVNSNAEKISITRETSGDVAVTATYKTTVLPSPGHKTGARVLDIARAISHIDADKGKTALALGFRGSSLDLQLKIKKEKGREKVTLHFPDNG